MRKGSGNHLSYTVADVSWLSNSHLTTGPLAKEQSLPFSIEHNDRPICLSSDQIYVFLRTQRANFFSFVICFIRTAMKFFIVLPE